MEDERPRRYRNPDHPIAVQLRQMKRIPKPDRAEYDASLASIEAEINAANDRIEAIKAQLDASKAANTGINDEITEANAAFQKAKQAVEEQYVVFNALKAKRDKARENADTLKERSKQGKQRRAMKPEEINDRIQQLEYRQETSSLTLREEKALVADIKQLKTQLAQLSDVDRTAKTVDAAYEQARQLNAQLSEARKPMDALQKAKKEALEVLKALRDKRGVNPAKKLLQERDQLRKTIRAANGRRKKLRAEFKKANDTFYTHMREVKRLQAKLRQEEDEEFQMLQERKKREKQLILDQQEPWQEERALCAQLLAFLAPFAPREERTAAPKAARDLTLDDKGKKLKPLAKKNREETFFGGARKGAKKAGAKKGGKAADKAAALPLDFSTLAAFNKLNVAVPATREAVPAAIDAVKAKEQEFKDKPRPKRSLAFFGGDRVTSAYGPATVVTQRKDKTIVVIMDWHLAAGAKVRAYLRPDIVSILDAPAAADGAAAAGAAAAPASG